MIRTVRAIAHLCLVLALLAAYTSGWFAGPAHWCFVAGAVGLALLALHVHAAYVMLAAGRPAQPATTAHAKE